MRATVLVMTAVGEEGAMVLEAAGAGVVVVVAAPVVLLEAPSADVDEVLEGTCMDVPVATAPLDDVTNAVLEMTAADDAYVLLPEAFGAGVVVLVTFVVPAVLVPTIGNDDVLLLVEVLEGTGVDVAATPVVLDDGAAVVLVLVGINDANVLLLEVVGTGVEVLECTGVEVLAIPAVLDDASPGVEVLECTGVEDLAIPVVPDDASLGVEVLECTGVEVLAIPAVLDDEINAVPLMIAADEALGLRPEAFGAGVVVLDTFVVPAVLVPTIDNDVVLLLVEALEGTGVDVAATPVVLDDGATVVLVFVAIGSHSCLS